MRILVTGASGFVGSALASGFAESGESVVAISNKNPAPKGCVQVFSDIRSQSPAIPEGRYDAVYHLAAATPMVRSRDGSYATNYDGTRNVLRALKGRTDFFAYVTGTGIYGRTSSVIDGGTPYSPHTKYSKVRLKAQEYAQRECADNGIRFASVCLGDVYGPGGWLATQIIPRIARGRFKVPGNGEYQKSFLHIEDAVSALAAIGRNGLDGAHVLADSHPVKFSEFIRTVCSSMGTEYPGNIPSVIASLVMGHDAVKMLTTPTICDGSAMAKMIDVKYPSCKKGVQEAVKSITA